MALTKLFGTALAFADEIHRSQFRKGTSIPYISHLMSVAALVLEDGGSETEAIAALLHDTLEDQGNAWPGGRDVLRAVIQKRFGEDVLRIVQGCTDDEGHIKDNTASAEVKRAAWIARKQVYVDHLRGLDDASVRRVSCADKLHNILSIRTDLQIVGPALWTRFNVGREDQLWYYRSLASIFDQNTRLERAFRQAVASVVSLSEPAFNDPHCGAPGMPDSPAA